MCGKTLVLDTPASARAGLRIYPHDEVAWALWGMRGIRTRPTAFVCGDDDIGGDFCGYPGYHEVGRNAQAARVGASAE